MTSNGNLRKPDEAGARSNSLCDTKRKAAFVDENISLLMQNVRTDANARSAFLKDLKGSQEHLRLNLAGLKSIRDDLHNCSRILTESINQSEKEIEKAEDTFLDLKYEMSKLRPALLSQDDEGRLNHLPSVDAKQSPIETEWANVSVIDDEMKLLERVAKIKRDLEDLFTMKPEVPITSFLKKSTDC